MRHRAVLVSLLVALATISGLYWYRQHSVINTPLMPIAFDHHDHAAVKCLTCHHNFVDKTGKDSCYFCHKMKPELALTIQTDFHDFCRGCHLRLRRAGFDSGPVRRCGACHDTGSWPTRKLAATRNTR